MALRKATGANVSVATGRRRRRREKIRPIVTKGAPVKREGPPSLSIRNTRVWNIDRDIHRQSEGKKKFSEEGKRVSQCPVGVFGVRHERTWRHWGFSNGRRVCVWGGHQSRQVYIYIYIYIYLSFLRKTFGEIQSPSPQTALGSITFSPSHCRG